MPLLSPKDRERARLLTSESISRAILAYLKPGAPHRFSPDKGRVENLLSLANLASVRVDTVVERTHRLTEARIGLPELGLGEIVSRTAREHYAWTETGDRLVPAISLYAYVTLTASMVRDDPLSEAQRMMLSLSPRDSAGLLEALRVADEKSYGKASSAGLTPRRVMDQGIALGELLGLLEEAGLLEYGFLKENRLLKECSARIRKGVEAGRGLNSSVVDGFLLLASQDPRNPLRREMTSVLEEGGMSSPQAGKRLLSLDKTAREKGLDLSHNLPPLVACLLDAMLKGAKPP